MAICVVGMTAVWLSGFKRLLYPVLYTFTRSGNDHALTAQGVYAAAFVLVLFALLVGLERGFSIAAHRKAIAVVGIAGSAGLALLLFSDYSVSGHVYNAYAGSIMLAVYLPLHFAYWIALLYRNNRPALLPCAAASFALFAALDMALGVTGLNSIYISLACPLVSSAAMLLCSAERLRSGDAISSSRGDAASADKAPETTEASEETRQPASAPAITPDLAETATAEEGPMPAQADAPAQAGTPTQADAPIPPETALSADPFPAFGAQYGLSSRETELASYAYQNHSARRIASELFIAESTVYTHLKRIYRKTGVHSKQELIDLIDEFAARAR